MRWWLWVCLGLLLALVIAAIAIPQMSGSQQAVHYRIAPATLKTFAQAQQYFRDNDCDGNGKKDYWRSDIAGLYLTQGLDGNPIMLIEPSFAGADDRPAFVFPPSLPRSTKAGYWYRALRFKDEQVPDPDRSAALAYPAQPCPRPDIFLISHEGVLYSKRVVAFPAVPPAFFPEYPLKDGWARVD